MGRHGNRLDQNRGIDGVEKLPVARDQHPVGRVNQLPVIFIADDQPRLVPRIRRQELHHRRQIQVRVRRMHGKYAIRFQVTQVQGECLARQL